MDSSPWIGNRNIQPYFERIKTALQEHKLLCFAYTAHHGKRTVRTVEPYQLVWKGGHWYFQGYCLIRNDYRLFRLSRMTELQMKQEMFIPRNYQKPVLDVEERAETMRTEIKIRIHKAVLDRVLEYCSYDHVVPDGGEYYMMKRKIQDMAAIYKDKPPIMSELPFREQRR